MRFSYNWLQSFFQKKLPKPEKLAEFLTMHSFEVSTVEKIGKDWVLDIDVLPNRGSDCFSHIGIARECAVILNLKFKTQNSKPQPICKWTRPRPLKKERRFKIQNFLNIKVENKNACPRYTVRVVTDVKIEPSPKWIQERLKVCGLRPINNIIDIVNYVMLETGQPLHAFDFEKIESVNSKFQIKKLIVRFAKEHEKIITLEEEKYNLDKNILVIADEVEPLAIAGIKGGKKAEIDNKTKIIVLESANFNPQIIRQGSKRINLRTDASWRFEHGLDPNLTEFAINQAAYLIQEIAKGKVVQGLIDFYPQKLFSKKISLDLNYVKRLLGIEIPKNEILKILKNLEFKILNSKSNILTVVVPTFRLDISLPENLIEEIARIYSYEKIPSQFPLAVLIPPKRNLDIFWENKAKDILKEIGFSEVYNYSFILEKDREIFKYRKNEIIEIENPISLDYRYLRPSLIPNLLKDVERNQKNFSEIKIFELGKVFEKTKNRNQNSKIIEKKMLIAAMSGEAFYQLKGVIDLLLNQLGISDIWYDDYQPTPEESKISIWHLQKSTEIKVNGEEIGFLGEISPTILKELKIEKKVVVFDINFEKIIKLASEEQEYRPISKYPSAVRDLAILVPREVKVEEVLNIIEITGGKVLSDVDLFDIYEGEELPEGKKNLAFHLVYQAEDHTLNSEEINKLQQKIIKALEENIDWQVRK